MPRLAQVVSFCIALVIAPACFAQSWPADVTVVSVLITAKELAEIEPANGSRLFLRERVARAIRATGQEVAFHSYVADVSSDLNRIPATIQNDPDWQKNRELEADAKRLFLAGDLEGSKRQLRQCRFIPHYDFCYAKQDYFLQFQFLNWELEAQNLPAALGRLRDGDWKSLEPATALRVARAYIIAGRQSEIPDLLSEVNNRFRTAAEQGLIEAGAAIRNLVNAGKVQIAIQTALDRPKLSERVIGLAIIAEGLANLPGLPDERLD